MPQLPNRSCDTVDNCFSIHIDSGVTTDSSLCRHLTLILCVLRYSFSYITFNFYSRFARFSYRTAFAAAAVTYGIVVYKAYRARARAGAKQQGGALALVGDENVQYLGMLTHCFPR